MPGLAGFEAWFRPIQSMGTKRRERRRKGSLEDPGGEKPQLLLLNHHSTRPTNPLRTRRGHGQGPKP